MIKQKDLLYKYKFYFQSYGIYLSKNTLFSIWLHPKMAPLMVRLVDVGTVQHISIRDGREKQAREPTREEGGIRAGCGVWRAPGSCGMAKLWGPRPCYVPLLIFISGTQIS